MQWVFLKSAGHCQGFWGQLCQWSGAAGKSGQGPEHEAVTFYNPSAGETLVAKHPAALTSWETGLALLSRHF